MDFKLSRNGVRIDARGPVTDYGYGERASTQQSSHRNQQRGRASTKRNRKQQRASTKRGRSQQQETEEVPEPQYVRQYQQQPRPRGRKIRDMVAEERRQMKMYHGRGGIHTHPVEETGEIQSRRVRITVSGFINQYRGGRIVQTTDDEQEEYILVHFRTEEQLHDGIREGMVRLTEEVKQLEGDSQDKKYHVTWRSGRDGYSDEEMSNVARYPHEIHMYAVSPIDNRRLTGAEPNRIECIEGYNCVVEFLLKQYKPHIPSLTRENIPLMLLGDDPQQDGDLSKLGWRIAEIENFCRRYKISHYALDGWHRLVHKTVHNPSNYPMLAYYCDDAHMYPITDKKERASLYRRFACMGSGDSATNVLGRTVNKDDAKKREAAKKAELHVFNNLPVYENRPLEQLPGLKDCVVYYDKLNLKSMLLMLYWNSGEDKVLYKFKSNRKIVTHIYYDNNVHLVANVNKKCGLDWKTIVPLAQTLGIPYCNQSIASLTQEFFVKNYHPAGSEKQQRVHISEKLKRFIMHEQQNCCNICKIQLGLNSPYECDHITPISNGGDAKARSNLQILCKRCHLEKSLKEAAETLMNIDNSASYYNSRTRQVFGEHQTTQFVHNFVPPEEYQDDVDSGRKVMAGLDLIKCRTHILLYGNKEEFSCFSVLNDPVPFDENVHGKLPRGFYFVESQGIKLPLKGNSWLCTAALKHCLEHGIIQRSQIKLALLSSLKLPPNYFHQFIHAVKEKVENEKLWKLMINSLVGVLGIRRSQFTDFKIMQDKASAASYIFNKQRPGQNVIVHERRFNDEDTEDMMLDRPVRCTTPPDYYEVVFDTDKLKEESHYPIYAQVLQQEWCELHKIQLLLEKYGGKLVHANTDNAIAVFDSQKQVDAMWREASRITWDDEGKVPKYKQANKINEGLLFRTEKPCADAFTFEKPRYSVERDPMNDDFATLARRLVKTGQSFQVDSMAGTGKTTLLREIMEVHNEQGQSYMDLTPTHKSAKVLSKTASTIHSAVGSLRFGNFSSFMKLDWLIIDEKSMIKETFFMLLYKIKQACPNMKLIIAGDWRQLPPPCDRSLDFNYEDSFCIWELCGGNMMRLQKCRRSDRQLFELYADPSKVDPLIFPHEVTDLNVTYFNSTRKRLNAHFMRRHAQRHQYVLELAADPHVKQSQDMLIFPGLKCIAATTRQKYGIANCDEYVVYDYDQEEVQLCLIEDEGEELDENRLVFIPTSIFTKLMQPAYAITAHRMQGSSVSRDFSIWDWEAMTDCLKYVALSRSRKLEYISICSAEQLEGLKQ